MNYVFGAGGLGREMVLATPYVPFLDDNTALHGKTVAGVSVLGGLDRAVAGELVFIGVGDPKLRHSISNRLTTARVQPDHWIGPGACLHGEVGNGSFLARGSVVTVDVKIGQHVAVLNNAVVGHDSTIGDFSVICPGAVISGCCNIGERVLIGAGAVVLPGVSVGDDAVVGAGSVVTRDVASGVTVIGNPARGLHDLGSH